MILHGRLEYIGTASQRSGHSIIDRLEIGGCSLRNVRLPDRLKGRLETGLEHELYVVRVLGRVWLLGIEQDDAIDTVPLAPFFTGAVLTILGCIYFCLWAVFEAWAYWIGIPMAFLSYHLCSICIGLIYFGY